MREKLIELLESTVPKEEVAAYGEVYVSTSRIADNLIANGVTIQKWIPVKERLPERFETVIVCLDDNTRSIAFLSEGDVWIAMWVLSGVTHWMPLPEPPKEE